ncbi:MAG TPA: zinc-dependent metalloprotease, partial [Candidatus Polarisedimenticolaceae bacterium]|nr:zinc-dependent metalloprotease [Candidatus Polarisedimenticolaceae bacterium]
PITPVAAADQRRALDVLDEYLFDEAAFALPPETLALLKADLHEDWNYPWRYASDYDLGRRIAGLYDAALATLFEPARLTRVLDNERRVAAGGEVFTLPELFDRLRATAFGELGRQSAERRALQRLLVDRLSGLVLAPAAGTPVEASQLAASSLRAIRREVEAMLADARLDGYALAHFEDVALRAKRVLDASIRLPLPS